MTSAFISAVNSTPPAVFKERKKKKLQTNTRTHRLIDLVWICQKLGVGDGDACVLPPRPSPPPHLRSSAPLLLACLGPGSGFNKEEGGKNNPLLSSASPPPPSPTP